MVTFALTLFLITILGSITRIQAACDENEFACNSGQCIDYFYLCDGEKNCQDGSDETKTVCLKTQIVCPPFAFKCSYGACVDGDKKCDGKQDCADNSDEKNSDCGTPVTPLSNSNNCPEGSFQCDSGQCISEFEVCDGTPHCRDSSDESASKCVNFPCPPITGFQCSYGGCIDKDNQCNGKKDCRDGSDELNCNTQYPGVPTSSNPTLVPPTGSLTPDVAICLHKEWKALRHHYWHMLSTPESMNNFKNGMTTPMFIDVIGNSLNMFVNCTLKTYNRTLNSINNQYDYSNYIESELPGDKYGDKNFNILDEDAAYGQYVASRLKQFTDDEKVDIKRRLEKLFQFKLKQRPKAE